MSTPKHTPGPWTYWVWSEIVKGREGMPNAIGTPEDCPDGQIDIAEFTPDHFALDPGEQLANACLLAAAPELLEVAEWALDLYEDIVRSEYEGSSLYRGAQEEIRKRRDVVARAKGERS